MMEQRAFLEILHVAERLKETMRHSKTSHGEEESVAGHSWRIALMAFLLRKEFASADMDKVIRMCLIHDLGECFTGDIPVFQKTELDAEREEELLTEWVKSLPKEISGEMLDLYQEMEALETTESRIYKSMDKLEAVIQHNESSITTWEEHEYQLQQTYAHDIVAFSDWLIQLREEILSDTLKKIETEKRSAYSYRKEGYTHLIELPSDDYLEPFQIFGNLYFVGTKNSACHLVDTGEGLILFDTGYPNMAGHLIQNIWKIGFRPDQIKMIFHTHGHFDHFGATRFLTTITKATTYMGEEDAKMLKEKPEFALYDYYQGIPTEPITIDVMLKDQDVVTLGNTSITAIHTPGHSKGAMTFVFGVTDGTDTYQAVLCGGTGFNSLNTEFMRETGENWRPDFEESLKRWKEIKAQIYLGNHTPQSNVLEKIEQKKVNGGNPFINEQDWPDFITRLEKRYYNMIETEG